MVFAFVRCHPFTPTCKKATSKQEWTALRGREECKGMDKQTLTCFFSYGYVLVLAMFGSPSRSSNDLGLRMDLGCHFLCYP